MFLYTESWLERFKIFDPPDIVYRPDEPVMITFTYTYGRKNIECGSPGVHIYFASDGNYMTAEETMSGGDINEISNPHEHNDECTGVDVLWATSAVRLDSELGYTVQYTHICLVLYDDRYGNKSNDFQCEELGFDSDAGYIDCQGVYYHDVMVIMLPL